MRASDLGRIAALTADLSKLETDIRQIRVATFDIVTERFGTDMPTNSRTAYWEAASVAYSSDKIELQRVARQAVVDLKEAAIAKIKAEINVELARLADVINDKAA